MDQDQSINKIEKSALLSTKNKNIKLEPSVIAKISYKEDSLSIDYYEKKINNPLLGFTTVCIVEDNNDYLINQRFFNKILKDKQFIAFREKSVYFVLEDIQSHDKVKVSYKNTFFKLFVKSKELRSNLFKDFRNIVVLNPQSESFALIRQSSPFLVSICVVDSQKSIDFLKNYIEYIDILITYDHFDLTAFSEIPRILRRKIYNLDFKSIELSNHLRQYKNSYKIIIDIFDNDLFEMLKIALTDSSYKKDCNLLLPVICSTNDLSGIDLLNDDYTVQGLIKFNFTEPCHNFNQIIESIEIQELYLRDNLYSLYKDLILSAQTNNEYKALLKKTLSDGVYYEKI